jgi:hypothetical protein
MRIQWIDQSDRLEMELPIRHGSARVLGPWAFERFVWAFDPLRAAIEREGRAKRRSGASLRARRARLEILASWTWSQAKRHDRRCSSGPSRKRRLRHSVECSSGRRSGSGTLCRCCGTDKEDPPSLDARWRELRRWRSERLVGERRRRARIQHWLIGFSVILIAVRE